MHLRMEAHTHRNPSRLRLRQREARHHLPYTQGRTETQREGSVAMHIYDPDGSISEYRKEKARRELRVTITWAVITVVASILILAAVDITLRLFGK